MSKKILTKFLTQLEKISQLNF